jgi:hypothetical protein
VVDVGLSGPGTVAGTAAYMAPEQARGEEVDARTDIFSLGAVLYEMATGKSAFPGKTSAIVFNAILEETPPAITQTNPNLPERLEEIVSKALEKDRDLRYQSAADLRTDLKRLKRDSESGRKGTPDPGLLRKAAATRRWTVELLAAAVLVTAAAARTWWFSHRHGQPINLPATQITPFTSYVGDVCCATFSPDGNQIAFLWNEGKGTNAYVKLIGETTPLRLSSTGDIGALAWSPDGHRVAFSRLGSTRGVFAVSALGGPERRLGDLRFSATSIGGGGGLDWSPDGKWLAVVDKNAAEELFGIFLVSPETGERRRLTTSKDPKDQDFGPNSRRMGTRWHSCALTARQTKTSFSCPFPVENPNS